MNRKRVVAKEWPTVHMCGQTHGTLWGIERMSSRYLYLEGGTSLTQLCEEVFALDIKWKDNVLDHKTRRKGHFSNDRKH